MQELPYACQHAGKGSCQGRLELDHITPHHKGGPDELGNMQWLCAHHHMRKTQSEAAAVRREKLSARWYPHEKHPGLK